MIFNGYSVNATYNGVDQPTYWTITATLNYNTIDGYVKENVPILSPYGYISIPDDNSNCSYVGVGQYNAAAINGYSNQQPSTSNVPILQKGEVCLVSKGNYAFSIKNNQLYVTFTNSNAVVVNTRITIDENVNTILIDTIAEIAALETKINIMIGYINQLINTLSTVQPGSGVILSPISTNPIATYTPTSNYTRDQSFLGSTGVNNFVDDNGKLII